MQLLLLCFIYNMWTYPLLLAVRIAEEVIPHYTQQLRERVQPDMITLGSLSLQQVRATKRNICVIIPYSPTHQPCPLCCVSVAQANGHGACACVHVHLSVFFRSLSVVYMRVSLHNFLSLLFYICLFALLFTFCLYLYRSAAFHFKFTSQLNKLKLNEIICFCGTYISQVI